MKLILQHGNDQQVNVRVIVGVIIRLDKSLIEFGAFPIKETDSRKVNCRGEGYDEFSIVVVPGSKGAVVRHPFLIVSLQDERIRFEEFLLEIDLFFWKELFKKLI